MKTIINVLVSVFILAIIVSCGSAKKERRKQVRKVENWV